MDLRAFPNKSVMQCLLDERYIGRKPIYDFIIRNEKLISGNVLDYGAGKMPYKTMFTKAEKYIGLDYSVTVESMKIGEQDVIYYDGKTIPFESETMDSVVCFQVIEHVEDPDNSIKEMNRVLKMGGWLMITVPAAYPIHLAPYDFRRYTSYGIEKLLLENGFSDISIEGSTYPRDTFRRLKLKYRKNITRRVCSFISNIVFLFRSWILKNDKKQLKLSYPLDYMIMCKKTEAI